MLTDALKSSCRPVNLHGRYSYPLFFSPVFAIFTLISLILFRWWTSIPYLETSIPTWAEWGILVGFLAIPISFMAGLAPYAMVKLHARWGYASVQCAVISLCLLFILALWVNPNKEVSPFSAFFQIAGIVGISLLFLWPVIKYLGTGFDIRDERLKESSEKWVLWIALNECVAQGKITPEEAMFANPISIYDLDTSSKLKKLPTDARLSVEREMSIQRRVEEDRRRCNGR